MENLVQFILHPQFSGWLAIIRILFILIALFFLGTIFWVLKNTKWLTFRYFTNWRELKTYRSFGLRKMTKDWMKIIGRLETGIESEYKLAVIEADSILDGILKRMGLMGQTVGDKLKNVTSATIPNIDSLWEAHKIRSNIVHDPDYRLSLEQAKEVLAIYEQTFTNLEIL